MLEKIISDLCEKTNYSGNKSAINMVRFLNLKELIDGRLADQVLQIIQIANRGIHGEIISEEYLEFITLTVPEVKKQLEKIKSKKELAMENISIPKKREKKNLRIPENCTFIGLSGKTARRDRHTAGMSRSYTVEMVKTRVQSALNLFDIIAFEDYLRAGP